MNTSWLDSPVLIAVITAISVVLPIIINNHYESRRIREQSAHHAAAVKLRIESVKAATESVKVATGRVNEKLDSVAMTTEATRILVNHKTMMRLQEIVRLTGRVAELTNSEEDIEAARRAKVDLEDHNRRQEAVDDMVRLFT